MCENKKASNQKTINDKCVICHCETDYSHDSHINDRKYYVEGAGQLCEKCYYEIYIKKGAHDE